MPWDILQSENTHVDLKRSKHIPAKRLISAWSLACKSWADPISAEISLCFRCKASITPRNLEISVYSSLSVFSKRRAASVKISQLQVQYTLHKISVSFTQLTNNRLTNEQLAKTSRIRKLLFFWWANTDMLITQPNEQVTLTTYYQTAPLEYGIFSIQSPFLYSVQCAKSLDNPLPQRTKLDISPTILRISNNLLEIHLYNCIHSWQSLCGNWNWPSGGRELRRVVARSSFLACWTSIASRTIFIVFTVEAFFEASPVSNAEPLLHSLPLLLSVAPLSRSLCKKVSSGGTAVLDLSERASERSNWF